MIWTFRPRSKILHIQHPYLLLRDMLLEQVNIYSLFLLASFNSRIAFPGSTSNASSISISAPISFFNSHNPNPMISHMTASTATPVKQSSSNRLPYYWAEQEARENAELPSLNRNNKRRNIDGSSRMSSSYAFVPRTSLVETLAKRRGGIPKATLSPPMILRKAGGEGYVVRYCVSIFSSS